MTGTDWLATLREQTEIGMQMAHDVPLTLARPDVTLEQVRKLFRALDHQAHFVEELANVLEETAQPKDSRRRDFSQRLPVSLGSRSSKPRKV